MYNNKIAYLSSEYPAISHTFIYREVQAVRKEGFEVHTASIRKPQKIDKMTKDEVLESNRTYKIKSTPILIAIVYLISCILNHPVAIAKMSMYTLSVFISKCTHKFILIAYLAEAILLLHWMLKNNIKHIHVHFANPASTVALIASKSSLIEYSISIHGPDDFYNIDKYLLKEKIEDAVFVRCISFYCRSQIQLISNPSEWSKIHIVHCGVDTTKYKRTEPPENEPPILLFVGRLSPAKGLLSLIDSMSILKNKGYEFKLIIIGDGDSRDIIQSEIERLDLVSNVTLLGAAGQDTVFDYYKKADIFVLPSYAEGLPVVLMEAMSMGIPCVTTRITGIPELIQHGVNGFLATPSDNDEFAAHIENLLNDNKICQSIGNNAQSVTADEFDVYKNAHKMAMLFKKYIK